MQTRRPWAPRLLFWRYELGGSRDHDVVDGVPKADELVGYGTVLIEDPDRNSDAPLETSPLW